MRTVLKTCTCKICAKEFQSIYDHKTCPAHRGMRRGAPKKTTGLKLWRKRYKGSKRELVPIISIFHGFQRAPMGKSETTLTNILKRKVVCIS